MNFLYGPSAWLLLALVLVALVAGPVAALIMTAVLVLIKAIQWINEYKKSQADMNDSIEHQLEILKYKNKKNQQQHENKHESETKS